MQFDFIYLIPLSILLITILGVYYQKLNFFIALMGCGIALGITYWIVPYQELVIHSLGSTVWYGYEWGLFEIIAIMHIFTIFTMSGLAIYNLYMTGGKKIWT